MSINLLKYIMCFMFMLLLFSRHAAQAELLQSEQNGKTTITLKNFVQDVCFLKLIILKDELSLKCKQDK